MSVSDATMNDHGPVQERLSPFAIPTKKLAMWLFLLADATTFAACLLAYGFLRNGSLNWPTPFKLFPTIVNVMAMTFILVTSSLTIFLGVRAAKHGKRGAGFRWTLITAFGGAIFALLHLCEWKGMIDEGVSMFHNPWGNVLFGASFFTITGLHLIHVVIGVIVLLVVGMRYKSGRFDADDLEIAGLYWHFVDVVWMFLVPLIYLLNVAQ